MKYPMVRLPITAPPALEAALGLKGDMRFWGTYWTPGGDEARIDTGRSAYDGNSHGYLIFTGHPYVAPHLEPFNLGSSECEARYMLVVDRHTRGLRVAHLADGRRLLQGQYPPPPCINVCELNEWVKRVQELLLNQPRPTTAQIQQRIREEYAACTSLKTDLDKLARHALRRN